MSNPLSLTLHAVGTESASGASSPVDIGIPRSAGFVLLNVVTISGGIKLALESGPTSSGSWKQSSPQTSVTTPGFIRFPVTDLERYLRVAHVFGSGQSASYEASIEAHTVYAGRSDLGRIGIPLSELERIDAKDMDEALIGATDLCDSYLRRAAKIDTSISLPLATWSTDLRRAAAIIGAYDACGKSGYQPKGVLTDLRKRYEDVLLWLEALAEGKTEVGTTPVDPPPDPGGGNSGGRGFVSSRPSRGWVPNSRDEV